MVRSFNGRTRPFDCRNVGSIPSRTANKEVIIMATEKELNLTHEQWEHMVLHRAIEVNGYDRQLAKAEEELIELLDAIKHRNRSGGMSHLFEEMADVGIMLDQMLIMFDCKPAVSGWRSHKLAELDIRSQSGKPF